MPIARRLKKPGAAGGGSYVKFRYPLATGLFRDRRTLHEKVLDYKSLLLGCIMAAAVFRPRPSFPDQSQQNGDTGVYACSKVLRTLGALSIFRSRRYYDGIIPVQECSVINFGASTLSGNTLSRYTYRRLLSRRKGLYVLEEDDVLSGYEGWSIEVYSYFEERFSDVAFSIYRFDGNRSGLPKVNF